MTVTETKLIELGNALARALGHHQTCPKHHPSIPCLCGAGQQQLLALSDWENFLEGIWKSTESE